MTIVAPDTTGEAVAETPGEPGAGATPGIDVRVRRGVLAAILVFATVSYTWALDVTGAVNEYYAAAALSGSVDAKAWFFGSLDSGNFITVDKAPFALWVQVAAVRVFGWSDWSLLLPQAALGVATVALLYAAVRRLGGSAAALVAAGVLATTPVTVALVRSNLPDAFLVFCLVAGAWALTRAIAGDGRRWLFVAMAFVGLGFNAKMLQAWIVLPGFAVTWALFGPDTWRRRIRDLAAAAAVVLVVSFSWLTVVDLWPASARPYVGGSNDNTVLDLVLGYNGLGRIFGQGGAPIGTANPFDSGVSWLRMFNAENADQISWLLPAAVIGLVAAGIVAWRHGRRRVLAALTLWGSWTLVTALVFSRAEGIYHPYYTVALAPGVAALVGVSAQVLWSHRHEHPVRLAMAGSLLVTGWWSTRVLARVPDWNPWLGPTSLALAIAAAVIVVAAAHGPGRRRVSALAAGTGIVALSLAPAVYSTATLFNEHPAQSPEAGPAVAASTGAGVPVPRAPGATAGGDGIEGTGPGGQPGAGTDTSTADAALLSYLLDEWDGERWIVAVEGSHVASPLIIAGDGVPVMAFGGFNGGDPTPTADELAAAVAAGELRFVLTGAGGGG
ncbi:MAG: glycosyl transferase, partial [Actinomyces sp.]